MIEYRVGDIFAQDDLNVLVHVCNMKKCFGAGIAAAIKAKYPEAYAADLATEDDDTKLGTFSFAKCADGKIVVNVYAMPDFGQFSYDAFYQALRAVSEKVKKAKYELVIGMPYAIGSDRAGGEFSIIHSIVETVFFSLPNKVVFCRLPSYPENDILRSSRQRPVSSCQEK